MWPGWSVTQARCKALGERTNVYAHHTRRVVIAMLMRESATEQWAREQERRAFAAGERRRGLDEAAQAVREQRRQHERRLLNQPNPFDFAAVAVLDEVVELLERLEQAATATYDYEVDVWMAELERVTTQVLPTSPR